MFRHSVSARAGSWAYAACCLAPGGVSPYLPWLLSASQKASSQGGDLQALQLRQLPRAVTAGFRRLHFVEAAAVRCSDPLAQGLEPQVIFQQIEVYLKGTCQLRQEQERQTQELKKMDLEKQDLKVEQCVFLQALLFGAALAGPDGEHSNCVAVLPRAVQGYSQALLGWGALFCLLDQATHAELQKQKAKTVEVTEGSDA